MGCFIVFEGGDGSGKSLQISLLKTSLENKGFSVFVAREPGGPEFAEEIRKLLLDPKFKGKVCSRAEMFLYMASRAQHTEEWIMPKYKGYDFYISDRYALSSVAYQGYGRNLLEEVNTCNRIATQNIIPNITFVIDVDAAKSMAKITAKDFGEKDRLELEPQSFHEKVYQGYVKEALANPNLIKIIQYIDGHPEVMHEQILGYVLGLMENKKK